MIREECAMINEIVKRITDNFHNQKKSYCDMAGLAAEQLRILQATEYIKDTTEVREIVNRRNELMEQIFQMHKENKDLQEEICQELELKQFVLSKIEGKVETELFRELKDLIAELGRILEEINTLDKKNQALMMRSVDFWTEQQGTSTVQAQQAYQKEVSRGKKDKN